MQDFYVDSLFVTLQGMGGELLDVHQTKNWLTCIIKKYSFACMPQFKTVVYMLL